MLCVLILKWLIIKCCLCLSKVVRALFLINDAKVQKIFQTTKYFSHFFLIKKRKYFGYSFLAQRIVILWLRILRISLKLVQSRFLYSPPHRTPHAATFP